MDPNDLYFHQLVKLQSDDTGTFRGLVEGLLDVDPTLGQMVLVSVINPGGTEARGILPFPLFDLAAVEDVSRHRAIVRAG